jgi:hypothetical protein
LEIERRALYRRRFVDETVVALDPAQSKMQEIDASIGQLGSDRLIGLGRMSGPINRDLKLDAGCADSGL